MQELSEKKWKTFIIDDLFYIEIGKAIDGNKVDRITGHYAYITRKENNNGLDGFIDHHNNYLNIKYPVITIGNETAQPYVQNFPFYTGTKVNILSPKISLSRYTLQFIAQCLKLQKEKYSYAFTINSTRLKKQLILLPVDDEGEPDYDYMEKYILEREEKLIQQYREYINHIKMTSSDIVPFNEKQWKEFFIADIFDCIQRGKRLKTANHIQGDKPYISSSAQNNGVDNFINNDNNVRQFEDCLTIANSGSVGKTFYHFYKFIASDHVTILKSSKLNKYQYLFLATLLDRMREKYSFNREINDVRIHKEKILLPVDDKGEPDYNYMEAYVKTKLTEILNKYMERSNYVF